MTSQLNVETTDYLLFLDNFLHFFYQKSLLEVGDGMH